MLLLQVILKIILLVFLLALIGGFAFLMGLGKAVGAGGNLSNALSDIVDNKSKIKQKKENDAESETEKKPPNQVLRTIGGVIFGGLMLVIPMPYGENRNGTPYISIDHQFRTYLVVLLVACEVIIFIAMWISERKAK